MNIQINIEESTNGYRLTIYDDRNEEGKKYYKEDFESKASLQLFVLRWLQNDIKQTTNKLGFI